MAEAHLIFCRSAAKRVLMGLDAQRYCYSHLEMTQLISTFEDVERLKSF